MTGFEVHQTPMIEQIKHSRCRRVNSAAGFRGTLLTQNRHARKTLRKRALLLVSSLHTIGKLSHWKTISNMNLLLRLCNRPAGYVVSVFLHHWF